MACASESSGLWGEVPTPGLGAVGDDVEAAKNYLRSKWAEFLAMGPAIIDMQHRAALVAGAARERGDAAGEAAAKTEILELGELNQAHSWAVHTYNLENVGERLGLGAFPVLVAAGGLAFVGLAGVVAWAFTALAYSSRKLDMIEAGTLTPAQAAALNPGPIPGNILGQAGGLATLALWGIGLWLAFQVFTAYKLTQNPPRYTSADQDRLARAMQKTDTAERKMRATEEGPTGLPTISSERAWEIAHFKEEAVRDELDLKSRFDMPSRDDRWSLTSAYALRRRKRQDEAENPPLVILHTNPPDEWGEVHDLTYRHHDDDQDYIHEFGPDVQLEAQDDGTVLLSHADGRPLWGEFEVEE